MSYQNTDHLVLKMTAKFSLPPCYILPFLVPILYFFNLCLKFYVCFYYFSGIWYCMEGH